MQIIHSELPQDAVAPKPSKGAMKRDMVRLQTIGQQLVELPAGKLAKILLPDPLKAAVDEARRLTVHGAKRRQLQYIGRIMEEFDVESISRQLSVVDHAPKKPKVKDDQTANLELFKKILLGGDELLYELFSAKLSMSEIGQIRTLVRNTKKTLTTGKSDIATLASRLKTELAAYGII